MKFFRTIKIKLVIFFLSLTVFSLNTYATKFHSINTKYGISMREVNSVCKDDYGFIWASSRSGIIRLTDDNYKIYNLPYEKADIISINLIYEHSKLIAYTDNGQIFCYNPVYDRFDLILNIRKALNQKLFFVNSVLIDESGAFWIALNSGLYKYYQGKMNLVDSSFRSRYLISWLSNKQLAVVDGQKISLFDIQTMKRKYVFNDIFPSIIPSSLYFDSLSNKLWIGTISNGVLSFDFSSKTLSNVLQSTFPKQPVLAIEKNTDSTFMFGVDGQGIWELDDSGEKIINIYKEDADDPSSLRGNGVYDIFCDTDKRVWICSYSGGLSYFDQASSIVTKTSHLANNTNSLVNNDVNSIIEDHQGKIWFATNNGISCWDVKSNRWNNFYCDNLERAQVFLSLCEDKYGRIWAGSYSSGVYLLDGKTGKEIANYSNEDDGLQSMSNFVFSIFEDSQGDIWIGGVAGTFVCYKINENRFRTYENQPVRCIVELSTNKMLLGCSYGVILIDKETGAKDSVMLDFLVQDIAVVDDDIWVCTTGEGLLKYSLKTRKREQFTTESGLPSNFVNSIVYANGYLWLGTENGACRFNIKDKSISQYPSIPELAGVSFNKSAGKILKNGQLALGTNKGAMFFFLDSIHELPLKGKIFFQDLIISGLSVREITNFSLDQPVDSLKQIDIEYSQNNISLELIPIGASSGCKLSWKMEGFDENWTSPSENRVLTYTNLPSGEYTLRIKLYSGSFSKVLSERFIKIRIIPPFWDSVWFKIFVLVFILAVFFFSFLYYANFLKQKHSEEKIRFFTNTAHDIRNSLTLIKGPVEELTRENQLSNSGRKFLNLAIEQTRRLSSVVSQLLDFQKMDIGKGQLVLSMVDMVKLISYRRSMFESFSRSKNVRLEFTSDREKYLTAVDASKIEKVVDNLISNAVKYSHSGGVVKIELKCQLNKWELLVRDQGIGISKKAQRQLFKEFHRGENAINSKIIGSGIGLLLVKDLISLHGGKISCESQEDEGAEFRVVVPYKKVANVLKTRKSVLGMQKAENTTIKPDMQEAAITSDSITEITILVVEDSDDLLDFMIGALDREFNVYSAKDGVKAWELISAKMPDLIVSDVMMPNMDGFELCQLIKSNYETSHIPVILLTGLSDKTDQLHGLGLGADDYLTKPFDMTLLVQRIKAIIHNREVVREKALKLIKVTPEEPLFENELNDKFLKRILEVVRKNISNSDFNKDAFASEMNVSPSMLYKKLKSLTDMSPTDFIKIVRLDHSIELLQTKKYTITEVSELCGFVRVGYFSAEFKKHFGKSPSKILE